MDNCYKKDNVYIEYYKWNKKSSKIFHRSCKNIFQLQESQFFQPFFSLYYHIHNTKNSHKLIDIKRKNIVIEILSSEEYSHYSSNSFIKASVLDIIHNTSSTQELFCKCIPLLDPLYFIMGNYNNQVPRNSLLPSNYNYNTFHKLNSLTNSAYIDVIFSFITSELTEKDILPSFPIFFGSVNGISEEFKYDITSEHDDIQDEPWFRKNIGKLFTINLYTETETDRATTGSSRSSDSNSSSSTNKDEYISVLKKIPCQNLFLEKLDGTLEDLLDCKEVDFKVILSGLFQISFALSYLQKHYSFSHNDLHVNNIMYTSTEKTYLYYKYNNKYFKVPTHGYIFKIIDYGRATFIFHGETFFNDSFEKYGEAEGQYKLPEVQYPLFQEHKNKGNILNYNFDLCRLAITMLDCLQYDSDKDYKENQQIINFIYNMTINNEGDSLYDLHDDFEMYIEISKSACNSLPQQMIQNFIFKKYQVPKKLFPKKIYYHL